MTIVDTSASKRKRERRIRLRQRDLSPSDPNDVELELGGELKPDTNIAPANPLDGALTIGNRKFRDEIKTTSTFFYGKVWFYNAVLEILLGQNWDKSKEVEILHYMKGLGKPTAQAKNKHKPLVVWPAVHDQASLNILVSRALETGRPVWFIGYPSTLSKHLLVSFQSIFLCDASANEIKILSDAAELSAQDISFLKQPKSGIYISKANVQSIHLTF